MEAWRHCEVARQATGRLLKHTKQLDKLVFVRKQLHYIIPTETKRNSFCVLIKQMRYNKKVLVLDTRVVSILSFTVERKPIAIFPKMPTLMIRRL